MIRTMDLSPPATPLSLLPLVTTVNADSIWGFPPRSLRFHRIMYDRVFHPDGSRAAWRVELEFLPRDPIADLGTPPALQLKSADWTPLLSSVLREEEKEPPPTSPADSDDVRPDAIVERYTPVFPSRAVGG